MKLPSLSELLGNHTRIFSVALDAGTPDSDETPNSRWHEIAFEGKWEGHWQGAFELSDQSFENVIELSQKRSTDTVVDYEHGTLFTLFNAGNGRAAGWNPRDTGLRVGPNSAGKTALFARIDWTNAAANQIRDREYRYLSPTFQWSTKDPQTGKDMGVSLHSIALTNTPFLDDLPEVTLNSLGLVAATRRPEPPKEMIPMFTKEQLADLVGLVGLSADADPKAVLAALEARDPSAATLCKVRSALGIKDDADPDAIVRAVSALKAAMAEAPSRAEFDALKADQSALRAQSLVDAAAKAGKIVASNREWATALAQRSPEDFEVWEQAAPVVVPLGKVARGNGVQPAAADGAPSDAQIKALAARLPKKERTTAADMGLSPEEFAKYGYADLIEVYGG